MKKEHLIHKKFKLPKGCSAKEFTIREIDGEDELEAARWIAAKGNIIEGMATAMMNEQLRIAIVAVDGAPVEQPFRFEKWNSRTHRFLLEAWSMLNSVDQDEVVDFLAGATDLSEEQTEAGVEILSEKEAKKLQKTG